MSETAAVKFSVKALALEASAAEEREMRERRDRERKANFDAAHTQSSERLWDFAGGVFKTTPEVPFAWRDEVVDRHGGLELILDCGDLALSTYINHEGYFSGEVHVKLDDCPQCGYELFTRHLPKQCTFSTLGRALSGDQYERDINGNYSRHLCDPKPPAYDEDSE